MIEDEREAREVDDLLRALDGPLPEISARDVIRRARRQRRRAARLRLAAGIAAALAAGGVAYALPGSPVRGWVDRLERGSEPEGTAAAPAPLPGPGAPGGGLVFDPAEPLVLRFDPGSAGHLRVRVAEGGDLVVRLVSGEGRFTSDPERLSVSLEATDTLELRIPAGARSVVATHGGTTLFSKRGDDISAAAAPVAPGLYELDLAGGPR